MKEIYLLPLWVKIEGRHPSAVIKYFNGELNDAMERIVQEMTKEDENLSIDIQWSINKHIEVGA